jgi:hypothetical protein
MRQAQRLGLWHVKSTDYEGRNARLRELGFYDHDSDAWDRYVAEQAPAQRAAYRRMEGLETAERG